MHSDDASQQSPQPNRGPKFPDVAREALRLGRDNALVRFACRGSPALGRLMDRLEGQEMGDRLRDLPAAEREELVAERFDRSTRTVRRWANWRDEGEI